MLVGAWRPNLFDDSDPKDVSETLEKVVRQGLLGLRDNMRFGMLWCRDLGVGVCSNGVEVAWV